MALINARLIAGELDDDWFLEDFDEEAGDALIAAAISALGK